MVGNPRRRWRAESRARGWRQRMPCLIPVRFHAAEVGCVDEYSMRMVGWGRREEVRSERGVVWGIGLSALALA